ncbi:inorganic pyrophosphatase [Cruoricaptor ignavus]|uniref:inorganic diphosphatase n=1 Tax=Cruoricaptor ignavus TaxID=1118202 RepID=A0A1M6C1T5_9FLAO|nr:inorganic pyrophosphatase [Cruoricaptor ignavus]QOR74024.1 inorganic pyrophosphatase [Cruoricaptor ignavus]SHI54704.1 inorganic pyrophosphatase [Cruoricaptor ignavus]
MKPEFRAHPWHGISTGEKAPEVVNVFVEIVPSDTIKYEIDKETGHLKVDRPQKFSNIIPALYGFIPRTYCADEVLRVAQENGSEDVTEGDLDPLDILVLSSHNVNHGNIMLEAKPIGGFKMIDGGEADDKIIAVMAGDQAFGDVTDIEDLPPGMVIRLKHYFLTYKNMPGEELQCRIDSIYGREHAYDVIRASQKDYEALG